jgi:hypothetical protein
MSSDTGEQRRTLIIPILLSFVRLRFPVIQHLVGIRALPDLP